MGAVSHVLYRTIQYIPTHVRKVCPMLDCWNKKYSSGLTVERRLRPVAQSVEAELVRHVSRDEVSLAELKG